MARARRIGDPALRPPQNGFDRHIRIGRYRHERRIGAVLQQPAHQIGEQIGIATDRRIDAADQIRRFGDERVIKRLAHTVQPLEFISVCAAGSLDHARHRERIVGGELRIEPRPRGQQLARAIEIAEIGHRLAGKHRIVGKAALLRAFDLGVPIGALDQAHHQAAVERLRRLRDPVDHRSSALLIGLHREAEAVPARKRRVAQHRGDHRKRQFQPVGLFGIDGEIERVAFRHARQFEQFRDKLLVHAGARQRLVARMQRRQFHRNSWPFRQRDIARRFADRSDGVGVGIEIALGIVGRARAFAQHVEGVQIFVMRTRARQRLLDGPTQHEMRAEQPHGLARGGSHRRQAEPLDERLNDSLRCLARVDHAGGDAERPGRGRHQQRRRAGIVVRPVAGLELVLDQAVGGAGIGHPQQRLGQHHQRQALLGGKRIGVQEIFNAADAADAGADCLHQAGGAGVDAHLGLCRTAGGRQQGRGYALVRRRIGRLERRKVALSCGGLGRRHGSRLRTGRAEYPNRAILAA